MVFLVGYCWNIENCNETGELLDCCDFGIVENIKVQFCLMGSSYLVCSSVNTSTLSTLSSFTCLECKEVHV